MQKMKSQECAATKVCTKCLKEKPLSEFGNRTTPSGEKGKQYRCKPCMKAQLNAWRVKNIGKVAEQCKRHYAKAGDHLRAYSKDYRKENLEKCVSAQKKWQKGNKAYIALKAKERYHENAEYRERKKASNSARHHRVKRSIPHWVSRVSIQHFWKEAQRLTRETGVMHHVDHIIPLNGKRVSGLTVPENLRVITGAANSSKSNKLVEDIV